MKKILTGLVLAGVMGAAFAQSAPTPKVLNLALAGGMKVDKTFPAVDGMTGYVLSKGSGQPTVVFTTNDNKYLVAGAIIDEGGKNLTADYAQKFIPKPEYSQFQSRLDKSAYLIEGSKTPKSIAYVFMDANCIFCHLAWKAFQPYEKVGLQVRWLPVAFLKKDSAGKAAAMLTAKDPEAALAQNETKFDEGSESGGLAPMEQIPSGVQAKIDENAKLMRDMGFQGTPAVVYKDAATGKLLATPGMVKLSELPASLGLPAQPNTDAELARFN